MTATRRLLVLSGGHPYEAEPFANLLASFDGWETTHLVHPEAEAAVAVGAASEADAIHFYDMPGYQFGGSAMTSRPPALAYRRAITDYFGRGGGAIAMHHAIAGWAAWPEWADLLGGRFLYAPGTVNGEDHLDSGYRHDVHYHAVVLDPGHPVTAGLPPRFPLCDELYLAPIWGAVTPLLRADHTFVRKNFYSAAQAVEGRMFSNSGWDHRAESDLIAWEKPSARAVSSISSPATVPSLMRTRTCAGSSPTRSPMSPRLWRAPNENVHRAAATAAYSCAYKKKIEGRGA